jgi:hypothetical protein
LILFCVEMPRRERRNYECKLCSAFLGAELVNFVNFVLCLALELLPRKAFVLYERKGRAKLAGRSSIF